MLHVELHVIVAPVTSSRLAAGLAGAWSALAAWLSLGSIAFSGPVAPGTSGARIGAIPVDAVHVTLVLAVGLSVAAIGWTLRARSLAIAVAPLAILFLPWLPLTVPAVFLAWSGALAALVWIAVAVALAAMHLERTPLIFRPRTPRAAVLLAGVFGAIVFSLAARGAGPSLPVGDEPHYLVITQSLLYDHDLAIDNNHRRGDYRAYYFGDLPPHVIRPGRHGEIYSIHAPGVPALVLPAFAIAGYHGVMVFLILLSAAGCALAWWLAWRATGSMSAAWFGWAVVTTCAPFLLESFTVFPDGPGAIVVLIGFWALQRADEWSDRGHTGVGPGSDPGAGAVWPWMLYGLALATLPWMHTRFAVLAGTLGGLILFRIARTPNPLAKAIAFLAVPAASALAWLFFFTILYGTPDPSAPYGGDTQNSLAFLPNGAGGLLFDQGFGLIATAPVLAVALAGFAQARRLAVDWLVVSLPYLMAVATFAMWWAGMSAPARFLVPIVLPLAIPAACAWASARSRGVRVAMLLLLAISTWMGAVMAGAGGGRLGYHTRNEAGATAAPYLEWANHVVDLPAALPAFVPQPVQPDPGGVVSRARAARAGFAATAVWAACLGGVVALVMWVTRRPSLSVEAMVAVTTVAAAAATMIAMAIVWRLHSAEPLTAATAQMNLLRRLVQGHAVTVDLTAHRRLSFAEAWGMQIEVPVPRGRVGPRLNRPIAVFPGVPAGSYTLSVRRTGTSDGWIMVGVGNDQFAIATQPIAAYDGGVRIDLPVDARALIVRADEAARDQVQAVYLRGLSPGARARSGDAARRAVRYDRGVVFFLDDRAYPEPSGFWVAGSRETTVALQRDQPAPAIAVLLRNGPVANRIRMQAGEWQEDVTLQAGEERRVEVPLDASTGSSVVRIRSAAGFRPSEADQASRDTRVLGVWVRLEP